MRRAAIIFTIVLCGCRSTGFVREDFIITDDTQIGVVAFDTPSGVDRNCGVEVADTFGAQLMKNGFKIMDRGQIEKVLEEQQFEATDLFKEDRNALKVGNLVGVRYILTGVVTQYGMEQRRRIKQGNIKIYTHSFVSLSAKILDCQTGATMWTGADSKEAKKKLPQFIARKLVKRMTKNLVKHKRKCKAQSTAQPPAAVTHVQTITVPSSTQ
jgi:hypothetical protein